jgi:hypothetical protein
MRVGQVSEIVERIARVETKVEYLVQRVDRNSEILERLDRKLVGMDAAGAERGRLGGMAVSVLKLLPALPLGAAGAWLFTRAVVVAAVLLAATPAKAHEPHQGHFSAATTGLFLHGKALKDGYGVKKGEVHNCCLYGGAGDCREVPCPRVEEGPDGIEGLRLSNGVWIPRADASLSPDGRCYICQHSEKPPHCAFYTEPKG